jgi:GxxExxY protein
MSQITLSAYLAKSAGLLKINGMTENEISYLIRGAIFKLVRKLGAGLYENVYKHILKYELEKLGLNVKIEVPLPVIYDAILFDIGFRIDLLVNDKVIIEIKSVEKLADVHHKQIITYLKLTGLKLGILVNFNSDNIANDIYRKVNNL